MSKKTEHTNNPNAMPDPMRHEDDSKTLRPFSDATSAGAGGAMAANSQTASGRVSSLGNIRAVMGRELLAYFTSPIALVVFIIFHIAALLLTFEGGLGGVPFWDRGYADLEPFYRLLPWLLLVFVPALSMRLWAEERQTGSIEMLLTLPMRPGEIVLGKFLGAWLIVAAMLFLPAATLTLLMLHIGSPDVGQIIATFLGAVLMAGSYLALGSVLSAVTRDQIVAFITTILAGAVISFIGDERVLTWLTGLGSGTELGMFAEEGTRAVSTATSSVGSTLAEIAQRISLAARFGSMGRGVIDLADVLYYGMFILFCLYLTGVILRLKR